MRGNTWHECRGGCGFFIGLLRDGLGEWPPGSVAHCKPGSDINRVPVRCQLYQQKSCAELYAMHENDPDVGAPVVKTLDGTVVGPWTGA